MVFNANSLNGRKEERGLGRSPGKFLKSRKVPSSCAPLNSVTCSKRNEIYYIMILILKGSRSMLLSLFSRIHRVL